MELLEQRFISNTTPRTSINSSSEPLGSFESPAIQPNQITSINEVTEPTPEDDEVIY